MSVSSRSTRPLTRAVGTVSCMRLMQRSSVDLPHPDGPMIAVTWRSRKSSDTSRTACTSPNHASTDSTPTRRAATVSAASLSSVAATGEPPSSGEPGSEADDEDEGDEDERSGPRERVLFLVGADRIGEYLQGKGGGRLVERQ